MYIGCKALIWKSFIERKIHGKKHSFFYTVFELKKKKKKGGGGGGRRKQNKETLAIPLLNSLEGMGFSFQNQNVVHKIIHFFVLVLFRFVLLSGGGLCVSWSENIHLCLRLL